MANPDAIRGSVSEINPAMIVNTAVYQDLGEAHPIFRAGEYGARGHNFMGTIFKPARERNEINGVANQVGAPSRSRIIAGASALIATEGLSRRRYIIWWPPYKPAGTDLCPSQRSRIGDLR